MSDVFVLTRGHMLDHTLVGVFTSLEACKQAIGFAPLSEWSHPTATMWVRPTSAQNNGDQAWCVEQVELDLLMVEAQPPAAAPTMWPAFVG